MNKYISGALTLVFTFHFCLSFSQQPIVIDQVVAVVGDNTILLSDIENNYFQLISQKQRPGGDAKCKILEEILIQKLLLNQAKVDSIDISETNVDAQLDARIKYFTNQLGSKENLEKYFNKPLFEIRNDVRQVIREQMFTERMRGNITSDLTITPTEVKEFYASLPADSVPDVNAQVEINQITKFPAFQDETIYELKQRMLDMRKRILNGEKFSTLAVLYSEDNSSARLGGEIGFMGRGELDPAYAKAAFSLKEGAVSTIVETKFGYHLIQMVSKQGDKVNTRHILMKPKAKEKEVSMAIIKLDSVAAIIKAKEITFEHAAMKYSDDKNTAYNGGIVINQETSTSRFELDQLNPKDYYVIRKMEKDSLSQPFESIDDDGKQVFKIVRIKSWIPAHKANLKEDYQLIQEMALNQKRQKAVQEWIDVKIGTTYLYLDPAFKTCNFQNKGFIKP